MIELAPAGNTLFLIRRPPSTTEEALLTQQLRLPAKQSRRDHSPSLMNVIGLCDFHASCSKTQPTVTRRG